MRVPLVAAAAVATLAGVVVLWSPSIPLGVPGEWTWARFNYSTPGLLWGGMLAAAAGVLLLGVAWWGDRRLPRASPSETAGWLALLVLAGMVWLSGVQSGAIEGVGQGKSPYVLYYRRTEGYFWQARFEMASVREFLHEYEVLLAERDYLHIGTHPPGLALLHRGLIRACDRFPVLVQGAEWTQPESVTQAIDLIRVSEQSAGRILSRADAAALWWGCLLTQLAAVLTVIPLFLWLRLGASRTASWRAAVFWPLVPAIGVFLPKSDLLYPVVAMTAAWLWRYGWMRQQLAACFAAGVTLWAGLCLSLAFLPVVALIAVQTLSDGWPGGGVLDPAPLRQRIRQAAIIHLAGLAGFLAGLAVAIAAGVNLVRVWSWNFSNHALFYEHNVRTWWKWLLVNPLELTLAVGVPVVAAAKWGALRRLAVRDWAGLRRSAVPAFFVVWTLLWLSGKNMGEAARLWVFLMPWLVAGLTTAFEYSPSPLGNAVGGAPSAGETPEHDPTGCAVSRTGWGWLLLLQAASAALTVLRVDGFHFTELTGT